MTGLTLQQIARALGGEVSGDQVLAPAPGHGPKDRGLSVKLSPSAPDGFVVHLFNGGDVLAAKDYVREKLGLPPFKLGGNGKTATTSYDYCDPVSGEVRYRKTRREYTDGSKDFYFEKPSRNGGPALLYGGERLADLGDGEPVWIVEGEKKVGRLRELGAIAVSHDTGSSSKWLPEHAELLRGLPIILWPDSDEPGEKYIVNAAAAIRAIHPGADIRIVRPFGPPGRANGRDICDWAGNPDQLLDLAAGALPYEATVDSTQRKADNGDAAEPPKKAEAFLTKASEIEPEAFSWVWKYYLARRKLHIIAGAPGGGKTTIYLSFAATISSGGTWPDGTRATVGNVLIWTGEDGHADTIIPRLMRMGADLDRIFIVCGHREVNGKTRAFNPATDMDSLREKAATIEGGVDFVFLDPVVAAVPVTKNSDKNAETRAGLAPFVDFAKELNAAAGGVTHVSKGTSGRDPLERVTGTLAYGAVPRIVLIVAENKTVGDDQPERIMTRAKSNIGPDGGGFGFHIDARPLYDRPDIEASIIVWEHPIEGTALEIMNVAEGETMKETKLGKATDFLQEALAKCERPQTEVESEALAQGISKRTLRRAVKDAGIISRKERVVGGCWYWSLT